MKGIDCSRLSRGMVSGLLLTGLFSLGGCATPDVPALSPATGNPGSGGSILHDTPTVATLVDHIRCSMRDAIIKGLNDDATRAQYEKLITYNFVATPELNVKVTDNQGLSPSLAFINPMVGSGSFTFSAGGQITGAENRNFDFAYVVDVAKLLSVKDWDQLTRDHPSLKRPSDRNLQQTSDCGGNTDGSQLSGDLRLGETLRNGVDVMDTASPYNIYGATGPDPKSKLTKLQAKADNVLNESTNKKSLKDVRSKLSAYSTELSQLQPQIEAQPDSEVLSQQSDAIRTTLNKAARQNGLAAEAFTSPSGPTTPKKSSDSGGSTKFGSTIEFNVTFGLNGGPSWSLKDFKGPSGTSGLVSATRNFDDSLQISFVATCYLDGANEGAGYWKTIQKCGADKTKVMGDKAADGQFENFSMRTLAIDQKLQQLLNQ